jgi:hypothetical protein
LGIDITNPTDRTLLSSTITSAVAVARGFKKPYANYPDSGTVLQSLKPFPQYSGVGATWTPLGNSWYDALQVKVTKRTTHGLEATLAYAYSKTLNSFNGNGNVLNRGDFKSLDPNDHRQLATISLNYVTPAAGLIGKNRFARTALAGWSIGSILQYSDVICWRRPVRPTASAATMPAPARANGAFPDSPCTSKTSTGNSILPRTSF